MTRKMTRSECGTLGAIKLHRLYDGRYLTEKARATFLRRFKTPEERRAYFAELGRLSWERRR